MFKPVALASILLLSSQVHAQQAQAEVPVVHVPSERAVLWAYRPLAAGLTAFERQRALAPRGQLRFKLRLTRTHPDLAGASLTLVGEGWESPLPLDADGGFVLPPSERADDDDAQLLISGKRGEFDLKSSLRVEVRTPGLPDNVVRLGDVRLECQVNQAIAKKLFGLMTTLALNAAGGMDWCSPRKDNGKYSIRRLEPFTQAVMVEGERRLALYQGAERTTHSAPIQDRSWSDDALIEFSAPR